MSLTRTKSDEAKGAPRRAEDPVLQMLGVGRELWKHETGDQFVERLRSEESPAPPQDQIAGPIENITETVWRRIRALQGQQFHTARGLPFTFQVDGNGIWFFRDRKKIAVKLSRSQVEVAISRCPLQTTTEIKDLMDYTYLFALLSDRRIREQNW